MNRRTFLGAVALGTTALAGCLEPLLGTSCPLNHEVSKTESDSGYGETVLEYRELTERGKEVFKKALESGSYDVPYTGDNAPPDFSYSDEASSYTIVYQGEEYLLFTYTHQGCTIE